MFIDPSMGGAVYNPFRMTNPISQRYGEMSPAYNAQPGNQAVTQPSGTGIRFFAGGQQAPTGAMGQGRIFRSFF